MTVATHCNILQFECSAFATEQPKLTFSTFTHTFAFQTALVHTSCAHAYLRHKLALIAATTPITVLSRTPLPARKLARLCNVQYVLYVFRFESLTCITLGVRFTPLEHTRIGLCVRACMRAFDRPNACVRTCTHVCTHLRPAGRAVSRMWWTRMAHLCCLVVYICLTIARRLCGELITRKKQQQQQTTAVIWPRRRK